MRALEALAALVGTIAVLATAVIARAIPDADITALSFAIPSSTGLALTPEKVSPNEASPDTAYCGYGYSAHGLRGDSFSLPADLETVHKKFIKSYIISGHCRCNFRSEPGAIPGYSGDIFGPGQGELYIDATFAICTTVGKEKRDDIKDLTSTTPAPANDETAYCGYAYTARGLRGDSFALPADEWGLDHKYLHSYIISGNCECAFHSEPMPNPERSQYIKGPNQGDLPFDAIAVYCKSVSKEKRDEIKDLTSTTQVRTNNEEAYCGYAYTAHGLRGDSFAPISGHQIIHHSFRSYIVMGGYQLTFGSLIQSVDIKGPGQGELPFDASFVICQEIGSKKRDNTDGLALSSPETGNLHL